MELMWTSLFTPARRHASATLRAPVTFTNGSYIAAGLTNILGWVTNYAGASFTVTLGTPHFLLSTDGTNWLGFANPTAAQTLITNRPVMLAFESGFIMDTNQMAPTPIPMPGAVTNLVVYALRRPDLSGVTNGLYGEELRVGPPRDPDDVTPKNYVDTLFNATPWWSAQQDVQLNGFPVHYSGSWKSFSDSATDMDSLHFAYLGSDFVTMAKPLGMFLTFAGISVSNDQVMVSIPTNGLATVPVLRLTRYLKPIEWFGLGSSSSVVGTNYVLQFTMPFSDSGYVEASLPSTNAAVMTVAGDLRVSGTIYGNGAGITNVSGVGGSQTPWASDIDAAGHGITGLTNIEPPCDGEGGIASRFGISAGCGSAVTVIALINDPYNVYGGGNISAVCLSEPYTGKPMLLSALAWDSGFVTNATVRIFDPGNSSNAIFGSDAAEFEFSTLYGSVFLAESSSGGASFLVCTNDGSSKVRTYMPQGEVVVNADLSAVLPALNNGEYFKTCDADGVPMIVRRDSGGNLHTNLIQLGTDL